MVEGMYGELESLLLSDAKSREIEGSLKGVAHNDKDDIVAVSDDFPLNDLDSAKRKPDRSPLRLDPCGCVNMLLLRATLPSNRRRTFGGGLRGGSDRGPFYEALALCWVEANGRTEIWELEGRKALGQSAIPPFTWEGATWICSRENTENSKQTRKFLEYHLRGSDFDFCVAVQPPSQKQQARHSWRQSLLPTIHRQYLADEWLAAAQRTFSPSRLPQDPPFDHLSTSKKKRQTLTINLQRSSTLDPQKAHQLTPSNTAQLTHKLSGAARPATVRRWSLDRQVILSRRALDLAGYPVAARAREIPAASCRIFKAASLLSGPAVGNPSSLTMLTALDEHSS
ncbi:hypothetical protein C8F01DRAFT_1226108 [Mycena amicta]|nr:hypothetical protein C8F01DRAFT_1226108 [Mycena amicta]